MADAKSTIPLNVKPQSSKQKRNMRDRRLLVATVVVVLAAWIYGYFANGTDVVPLVPEVIPGADQVDVANGLFVGRDDTGQIVGYAAVGEAPGYAGPIEVLVGVDPAGAILGVKIVKQRESPGFFRLVENRDFPAQYASKVVTDPLRLGEDLDAVTGATVSAEGVAMSVKTAVSQIAAAGLNMSLPQEKRPIKFGAPEIVLLLLFLSGYIGHKLRSRVWKRRVRWGTLIAGMILLGFVYTAPFTITMVISLLSGYWPDWHNNLYWYFLLGGIIFVTTVDAQNPYCHWFCPFGAFQECLAAVSGAKLFRPRDWNEPLKWLQRGLALGAVVLGLVLRQPGVAGYEPFGTLFDFRGTAVAWIFLALISLASLLVKRPFCNYLCPLDPVVDFIAVGRRWVREGWRKWTKRTASA